MRGVIAKKIYGRPLTATEQKRMLRAIEKANLFRAKLLKERRGKLFSSSAELIRKASVSFNKNNVNISKEI